MFASLVLAPALAASSPIPAPFGLVPQECWRARSAHILASAVNTDKWMPAYAAGESSLEKYTTGLPDPHAPYEAQVRAWQKDRREIVRAFAVGEAVRLAMARKDMTVGTRDIEAALGEWEPLKTRTARELASLGLSSAFAFLPRAGQAMLKKIWGEDSASLNRWTRLSQTMASRAAGEPVKLPASKSAPASWLDRSVAMAAAGEAPFVAGKPSFDPLLSTWDGRPFYLSSLKGRPILLLFTAWWCGACRQEMPKLAELTARAKAEKGLETVLVSGDFDVARTLSWLRLYKADMTVVWSGGAIGLYSGSMGISGWPSLVLINPDFRVAKSDLDPKKRIEEVNAWLETLEKPGMAQG